MRRFVLDMHSSRHPVWSMPRDHRERVRAALGDGWGFIALEEEVDGSGDGVGRTSPRLLEAIADAEVYCGFGISREAFRAARRLRWVHTGTAGVRASLFPEMVESDVILTNSAGVHALPVAEHALAMILYFARGFDLAERERRARRWAKDLLAGPGSPIWELEGAVVTIVGFGSIGRALATRCRALGMNVIGVRRRPPGGADPDADRVLGVEDLDKALAAADVVVLALPHTPETDRLIDASRIARMKPGAVLINVCRGRVVDEAALRAACRRGHLRGVGLDVFTEEPLVPSSPWWEEPAALLTPHTAGVTPRFWERETELICDNVRRYLRGEPLRNAVDKNAGY
ncbi:MAG: D-2-hydroxyacid dehydrogenase [Gemmatimonadetes bacterium]|nr:D-2-hydroxyacid dehydrogenase [Gemmatimonadota bacterium]